MYQTRFALLVLFVPVAAGCSYDFTARNSSDSATDTSSQTSLPTDSTAATDSATIPPTDSGTEEETLSESGNESSSSTADTGSETSCVGMSCHEPADNTCDTAGDLLVWNETGWCEEGRCEYASHAESCPSNACEAGHCAESPCVGVSCSSPPATECLDSATLLLFQDNGACDWGLSDEPICSYAEVKLACASGCQLGQCLENPCAGVVCRDSPARYCQEDTLIVHDTVGRCQGEEGCVYGSQPVECGESGCAAGRCAADDLCAHVTCDTPPSRYCADTTTLRAFASAGACDLGQCRYEAQDITCGNGCATGACIGDPCAGVPCNRPPASACADASTLVFWNGTTGQCANGVCTYATTELQCPSGCDGGRCQGDPCVGVICARPPASHCSGGQLVTFDSLGTCEAQGWCSYAEHRSDCPGGCEGAACMPDTDVPTDSGTANDTADSDTGTDTGQVDTEQEVQQPSSSLIWRRCPLGQTWDGAQCIGTASPLAWNTALTSCPPGYRLPTRQELVDLLGGCDAAVQSGSYGYCSSCSASIVCSAVFPSDTGWHWSSSPSSADFAWMAYFGNGLLGYDNINNGLRASCVRSGP